MGKLNNEVDKQISRNIRHLRRNANRTMEQVAKDLDLSYQQIQKYESGVNRISAGNIARLAGILGASVTDFYRGVEPNVGGEQV